MSPTLGGEEMTTDSYVIIPTTIQPDYDFGVPDSSHRPPNKPPLSVAVARLSHPIPRGQPAEAHLGQPHPPPQIYSFKIDSKIRYRYSRTFITSRVGNPNQRNAQEVRFSIVLPEMAFISRFAMEIDGKVYESYVKEKDEAKEIYDQAQSQGQSAGLVQVNSRNTNTFDVNVNIHPGSKIKFNMTYEELLERRVGVYEHSVNVLPEQLSVKDFQIRVQIEESQNITLLRVPDQHKEDEDMKEAVIKRPAGNEAIITWAPTQKSTSVMSTRFTVNYDLVRELDSGQVLVNNGYFVHFFSPSNLPPLRKHVVFILDTSSSMSGRPITQLKEAMGKILNDLKSDDYFNIITFATHVTFWDPEHSEAIPSNAAFVHSHWTPMGTETEKEFHWNRRKQPYQASSFNIGQAQNYIQNLVASGGTNIHGALVEGLDLTNVIRGTTAVPASKLPPNVESFIIFLTDGEPSMSITNPLSIQTLVKKSNSAKIPIFSLGFGFGADFSFLRRLSLQNSGFARKIYADSDATLQLKGFYNEIASPLLSNVTFNYTSEDYNVEDVTGWRCGTVFGGGEVVVAGKTTDKSKVVIWGSPAIPARIKGEAQITPPFNRQLQVAINGYGRDGPKQFSTPEIYPGISARSAPVQEDWFLERLWAYLSIKQLIDEYMGEEMELNEIEPIPAASGVAGSVQKNVAIQPQTPKQRAIKLAMKYGFVTPLTSLVVLKPNGSDLIDSISSDAPPPSRLHEQEDFPASNQFSALMHASFAAPITSSSNSTHFKKKYVAGLEQPHPPAMMPGSGQFGGAFHHNPTRQRPRPANRRRVRPPLRPRPASRRRVRPPLRSRPRPLTRPIIWLNVYPTATTEKSITPSVVQYVPDDTLDSLSWYRKGVLVGVNQTVYEIADNDADPIQNKNNCTIAMNDTKVSGKCEHLKDCIQESFRTDIDLYMRTYFCPVDLGTALYAGVCCDK